MGTKLFTFSATGNSLKLARDIASGLGNTELLPIPTATAVMDAARVGFVFPVVAWGLPRIVVEFLRKLRIEGNPYVFAVATCGGTPARTLLELRGLLRRAGADLHAGFVCREGANTVTDDPDVALFAKHLNRVKVASGSDRLPEILETIRGNRRHAPDTSNLTVNLYGGLMHSMMATMGDKLKAYDNAYTLDDRCKGCRTCERVCPRANVKVENGKPVWHHNCEMCNACIQWCPQQAIHVANETRRYRNPGMKAEDMMLR